MIRKLRKLAVLLAALTLSSCAEMPESLKETAPAETLPPASVTASAKADGEPEPAPFQPLERGNIDEIRAQLDFDLQKTYKNIAVERARVGEGSVMPTYSVKVGRAEDFDIYKFADYLFGDRYDAYDETLWKHKKKGEAMYDDQPISDEPTMQPDGKILNQNRLCFSLDEYRPTDSGDVLFHLITNTMGATWSAPYGSFLPENTCYPDAFKTVAQFDPDYDEIPDDLSYEMYGSGEWSLKDAIAFAEGFFNGEIAPSDPDGFAYCVKKVEVKALPRETFGYYFMMQLKDENGNFYDADRRYYSDNEAIEGGTEFMIDNYIACWCSEKERLTSFTKDYAYDVGDSTDSGDSLLTLGAAADILSENLAPNANLSFFADLNYVLVCKNYPYFGIWEYPAYYEDMAATTCELELKPYWCFRKNAPPDAPAESLDERYFVDALNGEIVAMAYGMTERRQVN